MWFPKAWRRTTARTFLFIHFDAYSAPHVLALRAFDGIFEYLKAGRTVNHRREIADSCLRN